MSHPSVDLALDLIRPFFDEAQAHIEAMKVGDKVPATKLAASIAERHGMSGPQIYTLLKFFFDSCPELKVSRGAHVPNTEAELTEVKSKAFDETTDLMGIKVVFVP
jgi:hypothetical protein